MAHIGQVLYVLGGISMWMLSVTVFYRSLLDLISLGKC